MAIYQVIPGGYSHIQMGYICINDDPDKNPVYFWK